MRNFNVSQLNRNALEQVYEVVLTQKICLEAKLERVVKELSVGACAIEDGLVDPSDTKQGLFNLIAYCEAKIDLSEELNDKLGALEMVNSHTKKIIEYEKKKAKGFKTLS